MKRALTVRIRGDVYTIPLERIIFFENEGRRIRMHTLDGEHRFYGTFLSLTPQLDERFLCCTRSYILNMDHIHAMRSHSRCEIIMSSGARIALSKAVFLRTKREFDRWLSQRQGPATDRTTVFTEEIR